MKKWNYSNTMCVVFCLLLAETTRLYSPGKLQYSSNSTINKSSVNRSKTLLSMFINRGSYLEGSWINFSSFYERSANEMPTFRSTSQKGIRAKTSQRVVCNIQEINFVLCQKHRRIRFHLWALDLLKVFPNQYSLNFLIFSSTANGAAICRSQIESRVRRGVRVRE